MLVLVICVPQLTEPALIYKQHQSNATWHLLPTPEAAEHTQDLEK